MVVAVQRGYSLVLISKRSGEASYEHKMKKVMDDMKAKPSIRANKDWDLTNKVSAEGQEIIKEIVKKGEITQNSAQVIAEHHE